MSQLWPELLRITLCPDRIVLERGKLVISLTGVEPRYVAPEVIPVEPRHEPSLWAAPLAMLAIAIDGLPDRHHDVSVILSNHFVRYPLVQDNLLPEATEERDVIDPELQQALSRLLNSPNCRLTSVQPRIIAFGTTQLDELHGDAGWLVLVEEGLACLGLIQDWEFIRLRNLCMWPASSVELLAVLDQEARRAGLDTLPRVLLLWKRDDSDEVTLPLDTSWQVIRLGEKRPKSVPRILSRETMFSSARA